MNTARGFRGWVWAAAVAATAFLFLAGCQQARGPREGAEGVGDQGTARPSYPLKFLPTLGSRSYPAAVDLLAFRHPVGASGSVAALDWGDPATPGAKALDRAVLDYWRGRGGSDLGRPAYHYPDLAAPERPADPLVLAAEGVLGVSYPENGFDRAVSPLAEAVAAQCAAGTPRAGFDYPSDWAVIGGGMFATRRGWPSCASYVLDIPHQGVDLNLNLGGAKADAGEWAYSVLTGLVVHAADETSKPDGKEGAPQPIGRRVVVDHGHFFVGVRKYRLYSMYLHLDRETCPGAVVVEAGKLITGPDGSDRVLGTIATEHAEKECSVYYSPHLHLEIAVQRLKPDKKLDPKKETVEAAYLVDPLLFLNQLGHYLAYLRQGPARLEVRLEGTYSGAGASLYSGEPGVLQATTLGPFPPGVPVRWIASPALGSFDSAEGASTVYRAPSVEAPTLVTLTARAAGVEQRLTITVQPVTVEVAPPSAALEPGRQVTLYARVNGCDPARASCPLPVAWSASGGRLEDLGNNTARFTAPDVLGSYAVTATSALDPARSATAGLRVVHLGYKGSEWILPAEPLWRLATADPQGNLVSSAPDPDPARFVLEKRDPEGRLVWQLHPRKDPLEEPQELLAGPDGSAYVALVGYFQPNPRVRLQRFAPGGAEVWATPADIAGRLTQVRAAVDSQGNVYLAGTLRDDALPGEQFYGGTFDCFVAKVSAAGALEWAHQFGTAGHDECAGVAATPAGVYVAGSSTGRFSRAAGSGRFAAFLALWAPDGQQLWVDQLGDTESTFGLRVEAAGQGYVAVAGVAGDEDTDLFLASFCAACAAGPDPDRPHLARIDRVRGSEPAAFYGLVKEPLGGFYLVGHRVGPQGFDMVALRYTADGGRAWLEPAVLGTPSTRGSTARPPGRPASCTWRG